MRATLLPTLQNRHRCCATVESNSSVTRCLPVRAGIEELREKRAIAVRLWAENQIAMFDAAISAARKPKAKAGGSAAKKGTRR